MPNRYSHAFVFSDYEKRGVFESIYQRDIYRHHHPTHHHQPSSSSFVPSSTRSSVSYTIETPEISAPTPSTPKVSPPRPVSSITNQAEHLKRDYAPNPTLGPTPASPPSHTPSSVITQIYKPQSPRSYFDLNSSQASHATETRPLLPSTQLYSPLSPLPTTLDDLDLDPSPGSEKTTPRSSVDGLTLAEMLLEAIPPSALDRSTHLPHEGVDALDDEADDAVPPPISRQRRDNHPPNVPRHTQYHSRPSTPIPRPGSRQRTSFTAQVWTPPRPGNTHSTPAPPQPESPSPRSAATPPKQPRSPSQMHSSKSVKADNSRPTPPPLQRTRTDLSADELQRWKKEVQQAKWRRGSWVGALAGLKGFAGRKGSHD